MFCYIEIKKYKTIEVSQNNGYLYLSRMAYAEVKKSPERGFE